MMRYPRVSHMVRDLRREGLLAIATREHPITTHMTPALPRRTLAVLMALVTAVAVSQATGPTLSVAASHVNVFSTEVPMATEAVLTTSRHEYRPAGSVRTMAQLIVPPDAHWETQVSSGSLLLTVASGALQVAISEGTGWIVHPSGAETFHELTPGESVVLVARDRLVMRAGGALLTGSVGEDPVIAAVTRVR